MKLNNFVYKGYENYTADEIRVLVSVIPRFRYDDIPSAIFDNIMCMFDELLENKQIDNTFFSFERCRMILDGGDEPYKPTDILLRYDRNYRFGVLRKSKL